MTDRLLRPSLLVLALALGCSGSLVAEIATLPVPPALSPILEGRPPQSVEQLRVMEEHVRRLAAFATPAVVHLRIGASHGSGVVVSANGLILTAAHVVGAPGKEVSVRFTDGHESTATTMGVNLEHDVSLLQLQGPGPWKYLTLAERTRVGVGEWCAAIGHPGGFDIERGAVFRLGRVLDSGDVLRTDCQLIGGDSGGPLVNMRGEVIGVHSRIGTSLANNLHIAAVTVKRHWEPLAKGEVRRGQSYIGVRGNAEATECIVFSVADDSPADRAGIEPGDIVTFFSGQRVWSFSELVMLVQMRQPGERVPVKLMRKDREIVLNVRIGSRHEVEGTR